MDPLSHALIGGLSAKTMRVSPRRFWIMTLLGMAPDLDVVANYLGSWAFVFHHRGITHSIAGLVLQSLFYAWILGRWDVGSFRQRAFQYSIPIAAHILADTLTSFGVPLLAPFSFREFSIDLIGSLNIVPVLIAALGLWWLHKTNRQGWKDTRMLWGVWIFYLLVAFSEKAYAAKLLQNPAVITLPASVQTLDWKGVEVDEKGHIYRMFSVNLLKGTTQELSSVPMPSTAWPVQASLASPDVQRFLKDYRWPVVRFAQTGEIWQVEWGTILFSVRGLVRGKVLIEVSSEAQILSSKNIVTFWTPQEHA